jgi:hypothetical protein
VNLVNPVEWLWVCRFKVSGLSNYKNFTCLLWTDGGSGAKIELSSRFLMRRRERDGDDHPDDDPTAVTALSLTASFASRRVACGMRRLDLTIQPEQR